MKSLKESLFDTDLTTRKLSIEKYMDDFSSNALEKLSPQERNALFDQLFESGDVCNAAQLRKNPVDLTKNIIMIRRDLKGLTEINYICKYNFIYSIQFGDEDRSFVAVLIDYRGGKSYCWESSRFETIDKKPTWKGKVAAFYEPNSSYSIITNEKWVNEIINSIHSD